MKGTATKTKKALGTLSERRLSMQPSRGLAKGINPAGQRTRPTMADTGSLTAIHAPRQQHFRGLSET